MGQNVAPLYANGRNDGATSAAPQAQFYQLSPARLPVELEIPGGTY
jgi:hypothetical protein